MVSYIVFTIFLLFMGTRQVDGHARMLEPPSRASMWRVGFDSPPNYSDNELNCGGFWNQWGSHDGKCGICGDPYQLAQPRPHEAAGKYANGIITKTYNKGQVIDIEIEVTANHMGFAELRLCPWNAPQKIATQECFDQHLLELADGSGSRWNIPTGNKKFNYQVKLPKDVVCDQCILQWYWKCGNSWGTNPDGTGCVGCGPQETFWACADIAIKE